MKLHRPSHATVVAYLALFTAIGGSAYAASKVGTNDLKPNAVTSPKIDAGAVRAGELKRPVVRRNRRTFPAGTVGARVEARCKKGERLLGGGGGWETTGGTVLALGPGSTGAGGPATDYFAFGETTTSQALEASAICVRK